VRTVPGYKSGSLIVEWAERLEEGLRHTPGPPGCDRWTAILGIEILALAMLLLASMATAFETQIESDRWLRMQLTGFFVAMGLSALLFTTRLTGTC
jgi:hypothetical protein